VLCLDIGDQVRMVTHRDVTREDIERVLEIMERVL
jgi:threonine aldolase